MTYLVSLGAKASMDCMFLIDSMCTIALLTFFCLAPKFINDPRHPRFAAGGKIEEEH